LISDVHGNYTALVEALLLLERAGATRLAFLGDYLGRGDSDRCVERIRDVTDVAIVGNRDLDWQDRVAAASKAWVLGLPRMACVDGLLLTHGDARLTPTLSTAQIGRDFLKPWAELERVEARVWIFGHSHFARTWRKASVAEPAQALSAAPTSIEDRYRYMVNVGTTGLPFPGKGGPSVAVVDFAHGTISHLPVPRRLQE
jgi:predicted phosphodiesterase